VNICEYSMTTGNQLHRIPLVTRMAKTEKSMPATELLQSEAQQSGRRLILRFMEKDKPVLDRIEFVYKTGSRPAFWQRGDIENNFGWTEVPQALSLLFLDYVLADPATLAAHFSLRGEKKDSLAASLGNAIYQPKDRIHGLFVERVDRGVVSRVQSVFGGDNIHGKLERERRIQVRPEFLPQHCIEIYWEPRGLKAFIKHIEFHFVVIPETIEIYISE